MRTSGCCTRPATPVPPRRRGRAAPPSVARPEGRTELRWCEVRCGWQGAGRVSRRLAPHRRLRDLISCGTRERGARTSPSLTGSLRVPPPGAKVRRISRRRHYSRLAGVAIRNRPGVAAVVGVAEQEQRRRRFGPPGLAARPRRRHGRGRAEHRRDRTTAVDRSPSGNSPARARQRDQRTCHSGPSGETGPELIPFRCGSSGSWINRRSASGRVVGRRGGLARHEEGPLGPRWPCLCSAVGGGQMCPMRRRIFRSPPSFDV